MAQKITESIREAGRRQLRRQKAAHKRDLTLDDTIMEVVPHYHIIYHVMPDGPSIPHRSVSFDSDIAAMKEVKRLGDESEPNTEWYEDGRVMIESEIHGRVGQHRIILEVGVCQSHQCEKITFGKVLR